MTDPARAFAAKVLREHLAEKYMDVFEMEDAAVSCGLYTRVTVTEPCGEQCGCSDLIGDYPIECLRLTDAAKALLAEYPE